MNVIMFSSRASQEIKSKEYRLALFDILSFNVTLATKAGGHCIIKVGFWRWETSFSLHDWDFNKVRYDAERIKAEALSEANSDI